MSSKPLRAGVLTLATAIGLALTATAAGAGSSDLPAPTRTAPVTGVGTADPNRLGEPKLVGVRVGRHARYDRTVFDFIGGTPAYRVEYGPLIQEGRGNRIPVAGAVTLRVRFSPAFAHDINTGAVTYDVSRTLNPRFPTLRQIKFGGDWEGVVSAGLGLADRVGFRVLRLNNPDRVAIDVAHQPNQPFGTATVWVGDASADTVVTGMRAGRHPGYDRLVFDLDTAKVPAVFVAYRRDSATVVVGFSGQNVPAVVSGPRTVTFGLRQLRGVSFVVYDNGTATAFVSTSGRHGFRVMTLYHPTRLVVDLKH